MIYAPIPIGTLNLLTNCVWEAAIVLRTCVALFLLLVLELCNQAISSLTSLVAALVLNVLPVDHWHILQCCDVIVLDHEYCAADFDYVIYF